MKVNDVIKTKSGNLYTIQRAKVINKVEYLVLFEVSTGNLLMGFIENDELQFVNDPKKRIEIAKEFDKKG